MKKLFVLIALSITAMPSFVQADGGLVKVAEKASGGKYGTAGCGLGALIFGDQKGPVQIAAATSNQFYGIQTFAITTGTSNCTEDGVAMADRERELFAEANFHSIKEEASMGAGENVAVLASLYGCSGASVDAFSAGVHSQYSSIDKASSAAQMLETMDGVAVSTCTAN